MSITAELLRGNTEMIILALLNEGDNYGYEINKAISRRANNYELKEATLYTAFKRLEEAGCISSYWGGEERGTRRHYYCITGRGKQALEKQREEWVSARDLIDKIIFGGENHD